MRLEKLAAKEPARFAALAFAWALGLRLLLLALVAWHTGQRARDLALVYDGHVYILIAKSFPHLYAGIEKIFPAYTDSTFFTGWFPLYPIAIALTDLFLRDAPIAALAAAQLLASLAVSLFFFLARRTVGRPALATFLFSFFPATWLLTGTLSFVEPALVCCLLAAAERFLAGKEKPATFFAALAVVAQKTGVLILAVFALAILWKEGKKGWGRIPKFAPALAGLALLELYLWRLFGDPLILERIQGHAFHGAIFQLPFKSIAEGLFSPTQMFHGHFLLRKFLIASSCLFYCAALFASGGANDGAGKLLRAWLGVILFFHVSLAIYNLYGYYSFARYLVMAAPAAVLLAVRDERLGSRFLWMIGVAGLGLVLAVDVIEISAAFEFTHRAWPPGYFEALAARL